MPTVTYIGPDGAERQLEAEAGDSVMALAVRNGVTGIIGECGGQLSCATCHVWVKEPWLSKVGPAHGLEVDLLEMGVTDFCDASRLGCQIKITPELDGLTVEPRPESWH